MANRKCTPDQLPQVIQSILNEYADDIISNIPEITERIGKEGVKALRSESKAKFKGKKYAGGWKSTPEIGRLEAKVTIHNGRLPGLPHLLEHGHAMRGGGRVNGRKHIAQVEEKLIKDFEKAIEDEITRNS